MVKNIVSLQEESFYTPGLFSSQEPSSLLVVSDRMIWLENYMYIIIVG